MVHINNKFISTKHLSIWCVKKSTAKYIPKSIDSKFENIRKKYGLVVRTDYLSLPLKVEYNLTALGKELSILLKEITDWTYQHIHELIAAEQAFNKKYNT